MLLQVTKSSCPGKRTYSLLKCSISHRSELLSVKTAQVLKEMEKWTLFPRRQYTKHCNTCTFNRFMAYMYYSSSFFGSPHFKEILFTFFWDWKFFLLINQPVAEDNHKGILLLLGKKVTRALHSWRAVRDQLHSQEEQAVLHLWHSSTILQLHIAFSPWDRLNSVKVRVLGGFLLCTH